MVFRSKFMILLLKHGLRHLANFLMKVCWSFSIMEDRLMDCLTGLTGLLGLSDMAV